MRKIQLDTDALEVETFATEADADAGGGTVHGRQASYDGTDCQTYQGGTTCMSGGRLCDCGCDPTPYYCG